MQVFERFSIDFDWSLPFCTWMKVSKSTHEMMDDGIVIPRWISLPMFDSNFFAIDEPSKVTLLNSVIQALNLLSRIAVGNWLTNPKWFSSLPVGLQTKACFELPLSPLELLHLGQAGNSRYWTSEGVLGCIDWDCLYFLYWMSTRLDCQCRCCSCLLGQRHYQWLALDLCQMELNCPVVFEGGTNVGFDQIILLDPIHHFAILLLSYCKLTPTWFIKNWDKVCPWTLSKGTSRASSNLEIE